MKFPLYNQETLILFKIVKIFIENLKGDMILIPILRIKQTSLKRKPYLLHFYNNVIIMYRQKIFCGTSYLHCSSRIGVVISSNNPPAAFPAPKREGKGDKR